jgi:threonine/homoserine/homoserine lactone efflux protein
MEPIFFLKGLVIGFAMGVPIGPAGILCIRKTLAESRSRGMVIGLGAATSDMLCGCIAAFGLTIVSDAIASHEFWLRLVGGVLLLFLGIKTLRAKVKDPIARDEGRGLLGWYFSVVFLGLTNPVTIFAYIGVFAAFGLGQRTSTISAYMPVLGVFVGSCLWFLTLGYVASLFSKKLESGGLRWVNAIAGVLIILSGVAAFASIM